MEKYELPLVIFTVLGQMSVRITFILTLRVLQGKLESKRLYWLVSRLVLAAVSVATISHLAHPSRTYDTLINLQHAWLSREILGATLHGTAVGVTFLAKRHKAPAVLASVLGIVLVAVQGMTYTAPAMMAIADDLTILLFFITVQMMGYATIPLLNLAPTVAALRQRIAVYMVVIIAAPVIWLSGNTTMQMTTHAWLTSPLYLVSLMCLAVAFVPSRQGERHAKAFFVLLFAGVLPSHLMFFSDTISSIVDIDHLY